MFSKMDKGAFALRTMRNIILVFVLNLIKLIMYSVHTRIVAINNIVPLIFSMRFDSSLA